MREGRNKRCDGAMLLPSGAEHIEPVSILLRKQGGTVSLRHHLELLFVVHDHVRTQDVTSQETDERLFPYCERCNQDAKGREQHSRSSASPPQRRGRSPRNIPAPTHDRREQEASQDVQPTRRHPSPKERRCVFGVKGIFASKLCPVRSDMSARAGGRGGQQVIIRRRAGTAFAYLSTCEL